MRPLHAFALATLLAVAPAASRAAQEQLVILRFAGEGFAGPVLDSATATAETAALRTSARRLKIVTRDMLAAIVGEEKLVRCEAQARCELDLGVGLGTGYLLAGSLRQLGRRLEVTVKLYDVRKLDLLAQEKESAMDADALLAKVEPLVERVMRSGLALGAPVVPPTPAVAVAEGASATDMVRLPRGTYRMRAGDRAVAVEPFLLDVTEVTVGAYARCVDAGKCRPAWSTVAHPVIPDPAKASEACNGVRPDRVNHPVNCVDWTQAAAFCAALGKRLPTEEEWEWAARGAERGTAYPWGDEPPGGQLCWNGPGNGGGKGNRQSTCEVGSHPAGDSPHGVRDLAGNVTEWTASTQTEEWMSTVREYRVSRGSGWLAEGGAYVSGARFLALPQHRTHSVGFRCARSP